MYWVGNGGAADRGTRSHTAALDSSPRPSQEVEMEEKQPVCCSSLHPRESQEQAGCEARDPNNPNVRGHNTKRALSTGPTCSQQSPQAIFVTLYKVLG